MRRSGLYSIGSSPVIIGALTVLITILAVFLAYNATAGLPFVPTYSLSALVPDANSLVANNEVRIGGIRVGLVKAITPVRLDDGRTVAKLDMELNQDVEPLPVDSTVLIRNRSTLGLKYLEITPGKSDEGYPAGATIPTTAARPTPGGARSGAEHVQPPNPDRRRAEPEGVRRRARRPRPRPQRCDRRDRAVPPPRAAGPRQSRLGADQPRRLLQRPVRPRVRGRAGGRDRGAALRRPRPDLRRVRRDRAAVPPGHDLRGARDPRRGDPHLPGPEPVPRALAPILYGLPARGRGARGHLTGDRRRPARRASRSSTSRRSSTASSSRPRRRCSTSSRPRESARGSTS